jgi:CRISPR-associated protein Cas5d
MSNRTKGIRLRVRGDYACFTRPEMKVERVSYDVMTPSAARGVLEAIYWKPEIAWVIERIHVLSPIRFTNLRRNEVDSKIPAANVRKAMKAGSGLLAIHIEDARQQRAATILRDVEYIIEARFEVKGGDDPAEKHFQMFQRRAKKGQYFHHPYLGCREFPADFAWVEAGEELETLPITRDLGWMLHDIDFENGMASRFFKAELKAGVLEVPPFESEEVKA